MTQITCDIRDSQGLPLPGFIRVTLSHDLAALGRSYLVVPSDVPLVNGLATLDLEPSILQNTSYLFQIYRRIGTPVYVDTLFKEFHAIVPDSPTPVPLTDLVPTGVTQAAQDTAIASVTRRLYLAPEFWNGIRNNVFKVLGAYSPTTTYKQGNVVSWNGGTYVYIRDVATEGVSPSDQTHWQQWAAQGATGAGTTGNPAPYDPVGWQGATDAPSRGAVRDVIQTLATQDQLTGIWNNPSLVNPTRNSLANLADRSSNVPSTQWVQAVLDVARRALTPVGMVGYWFTPTPPAGWLVLDGSLVSRTVYAELFAVFGTYFGAGDGSTTFRLPDCRGRTLVGVDDMGTTGAANRLTSTWADIIGGAGGLEEVALSVPQLPSHSHTIGGGANLVTASGGANTYGTSSGLNFGQIANASNSTGAGLPHTNIQPSIACILICYSGVV